MIKIVAAYSLPNRVIGKDGDLPWRYEEDLAKFRENVRGCAMVAGRITGRQVNFLKQRTYIVSREGQSFQKALELAKENVRRNGGDVAIVGGQAVFEEGIKVADEMFITHINQEYEGDRFFPFIDYFIWEVVSNEQSQENPDLCYVHYRRKNAHIQS